MINTILYSKLLKIKLEKDEENKIKINPIIIDNVKVIFVDVLKILLILTLSPLNSAIYFVTPLLIPPDPNVIRIPLKLDNWPSKATPEGPTTTANTLTEIRLVSILIKVENAVKEKTLNTPHWGG